MVLKNGFTIVGGTWWTNFHGSHESGMKAATGIMDFYRIKELVDYKDPVDRYQLMRRIHEETTDWMRQQPKADMIVTHFPPALQSIHGTYEGDSLNPYFVNDAEDLVRELEPRFWVHGHTHNPFDYMIGKTRVVANPIGYPGERFLQGPFKPLRIEVCDI
jgi:Icc-related predicted phosphoesterase